MPPLGVYGNCDISSDQFPRIYTTLPRAPLQSALRHPATVTRHPATVTRAVAIRSFMCSCSSSADRCLQSDVRNSARIASFSSSSLPCVFFFFSFIFSYVGRPATPTPTATGAMAPILYGTLFIHSFIIAVSHISSRCTTPHAPCTACCAYWVLIGACMQSNGMTVPACYH